MVMTISFEITNNVCMLSILNSGYSITDQANMHRLSTKAKQFELYSLSK